MGRMFDGMARKLPLTIKILIRPFPTGNAHRIGCDCCQRSMPTHQLEFELPATDKLKALAQLDPYALPAVSTDSMTLMVQFSIEVVNEENVELVAWIVHRLIALVKSPACCNW